MSRQPAPKCRNQTEWCAGYTVVCNEAQVLDWLGLVTRTNDDIWQWDPKTWEVLGSNAADPWTSNTWTKLGSGNTGLANGRGAASVVTFTNTTAYTHYKVVFPTVKGLSPIHI